MSDETLIEYQLRDGYSSARKAGVLSWRHIGESTDIVRYRIVKTD